jgi:transposase
MCLRADYVNRIQQAVEDRVWAIESCNGIGHHITMRLLTADEQVVDVPPKLSVRARIFATGQGPQGRRPRRPVRRLGRHPGPGLRPVLDDEQRRERLLQPVRLSRGSGRAAAQPRNL